MKEQMFSIETDPDEGLRIVVTRPDGTRVTIRGGQSESLVLDHEARSPSSQAFLSEATRTRAARSGSH